MFKWLLHTAIALVLVCLVFLLDVVSMPEIDQYLSLQEFNLREWKSWKVVIELLGDPGKSVQQPVCCNSV